MRRRLATLLALGGAGAAATAALALGAASLTAGKITEFPVPTADSQPAEIAAGPDGNLWFTEQRVNKVARITPNGTVTEFPLPHGCCVTGIASGADGNLWITIGGATFGRIGRVTPAGGYSEFVLPLGRYGQGIAAGPDGNVWFAETPGNRIGRITPAGVLTEFRVPTPSSQPSDIAAGPDGNLWFTEVAGDKIGRITPGGEVVEFPVPTPNSGLTDIAAGPDGNLWYTRGNFGGAIGRITPWGAITEFAPPVGAESPGGIVAGPDGNLWFAGSRAIGRITPSGVTTGFGNLPSAPLGIATGPDGNIWFTEYNSGLIGRLKAAAPGRRYVLALASGFVPAARTVGQGQTAQWSFYAPSARSVTDSSGMNLFDSGAQLPVSQFSFAFAAAGAYPYADTFDPALTGTIRVPALASPRTGSPSTTFTVTWAAAPLPAGFVADVQIRRPGSSSFGTWLAGQTGTSASFVPDAGAGTYAFRARLRKEEDGTQSGWSPAATIAVT